MSDTKPIADFSQLGRIKAPGVDRADEARKPVGSWVDRPVAEPLKEESRQISVRAPISVISRLQRICKEERYSYGEMLERMLDAYENRQS